jgi:hypothetical protein
MSESITDLQTGKLLDSQHGITFNDMSECIGHYKLTKRDNKWNEIMTEKNRRLLYKADPVSNNSTHFIFRAPDYKVKDREAIISV